MQNWDSSSSNEIMSSMFPPTRHFIKNTYPRKQELGLYLSGLSQDGQIRQPSLSIWGNLEESEKGIVGV